MDARIGTLNDGSFYAYANGFGQPETRGTLAEVEFALGLRASLPAPTAPVAVKSARVVIEYRVTVTPRVVSYCGGFVDKEYTEIIEAKTAKEAISEARYNRRQSDPLTTGATYSAKRI